MVENLGKVAWRKSRRNRQRSRYHSHHTNNLAADSHGNLYIYHSQCDSKPWLGIIMARIVQEKDDHGKTVWIVFDHNDKVVIITKNEHTAKYYYDKEKE